MSVLPWLLWMVVRQKWARWRERALLLSEADANRILGFLALPGFASQDARMTFPRDLAAARRALTRVRLGADVDAATEALWDRFCVFPSDILGYPGPVRMVLTHYQDGHWTAIPWTVPESVAVASAAWRTVEAVFEDDAPELVEDAA